MTARLIATAVLILAAAAVIAAALLIKPNTDVDGEDDHDRR